ncbi:collagen alpha-1(IV) chain-like [Bacillus rossius redtenbacheri]|uniref:collagen alpha-1(IV) chain-like n=1 Tax=Bacillus rossius redtenbacheri TaxID=93214 RepID=UPI002FDE96BC
MMAKLAALALLCLAVVAAAEETPGAGETTSKSKIQQHFLGLGGGYRPLPGYPGYSGYPGYPGYLPGGARAGGYLGYPGYPGYPAVPGHPGYPGYSGYPSPGHGGAAGGFYPAAGAQLPFVFYSADKDKKTPGKDGEDVTPGDEE